MANFKAPIATLFNGEQFELVNGNVINAKAIFNIEIGYDGTDNKYACNHNLAEIAEAVGKGADINVKFTGADGKVSYDQWGIDEIDAAKVVFKNGYYRNDEDYERCWIEESIELLAAYVKDAKTLELVEKVVYSRDYKIKYACGNLPAGAAAPVGKFPAPKFVSEVLNDSTGEYEGRFELIDEDLVAPTATVEGLEFKGWCYDKACENKAEVDHAEITKDVKLYAKWAEVATPVEITVRFQHISATEQAITESLPVGTVLDLVIDDGTNMASQPSADIQRWMGIAGGSTFDWADPVLKPVYTDPADSMTVTAPAEIIIMMQNAG